MTTADEPLRGRGVTVREGGTVRRPVRPWTPAVQALLRYLEGAGFDGAPRVLGVEEQRREVLSYIPGEDGHYTARTQPGLHGDTALAAVARLIRRYHDTVAGFVPPAHCAWQFMAGAPHEGIVCHNDLGPVNTVYRDGLPVAFIDWEFAAPAPPAWDLAYAAWRYIPLYTDATCSRFGYPITPRGPRLRLFCDAYGLEERAGFVDLIRARQQSLYETLRGRAQAGEQGYVEVWRETRGEQWLADMRYLDEERDIWERILIA